MHQGDLRRTRLLRKSDDDVERPVPTDGGRSLVLIGGEGLGLRAALPEELPTTRSRRCGEHETADVLDTMPTSVQGCTNAMIHDIYQAVTQKYAQRAYAHAITTFRVQYPSAIECPEKDRDELFTFYAPPAAEHWQQSRSTNVFESVFATVRLRTEKS